MTTVFRFENLAIQYCLGTLMNNCMPHQELQCLFARQPDKNYLESHISLQSSLNCQLTSAHPLLLNSWFEITSVLSAP